MTDQKRPTNSWVVLPGVGAFLLLLGLIFAILGGIYAAGQAPSAMSAAGPDFYPQIVKIVVSVLIAFVGGAMLVIGLMRRPTRQ